MAIGTGAALIASALIASGTAAVTSGQARSQSSRQANQRAVLARRTRVAEVTAQEAQAQRLRDKKAVADAEASRIRNVQLRAQGIKSDLGDLDISVAALGTTSSTPATSALGSIQPDKLVR